MIAPINGKIPAQGCWSSGWDYYHYYQHQNLPGLNYYSHWSTYQEHYPVPRSIYPQPHGAFHWTTITMPESYWLSVPQATVLSGRQSVGSVVAHDGKVIHDLSRQWANHPQKNEACHHKFPRPTLLENTIAVLGIGGGGMNYYHWLTDVLPRINLLKYGGIWDKIDYFLIDEPSPKMAIGLDILGIPLAKRIYTRFDRVLSSPLVIAPQFLRAQPRWRIDFLRETFLPHRDTNYSKIEKIYISRSKASRRRILNEAEILDYLTPLGYVPCWLEDLSFLEQVSLFSQAKFVIGLHGAGLTNIAWCPPGGRLLEIFPSESIPSYYWVLASQVGVDYYYLLSLNSPPLSQDDTVIDLKQFQQAVEHLES
ncbi:glycosyltransferase family 61 protein [Gloeomargarita lithophora]|uniref:glycosyltransferase family 61 protein n=1 Tax=Gloeomargarita lithophora TaxID=1188228 RepID=UPI0008F96A04